MDAYEPLEVIGSGSFGMIRKIRRKSDGKVLARKEIDYRKMSDREKRQLVAEVNILRELRHPNVVRYYERFVDRENCLIYIVMEYCEGGDLAAIIKRCRKEGRMVPEHIVWNLFTQLVLALHECHHPTPGKDGHTRQVILHRDLKPDNVLLDAEQNVKLGDFGLSRVMDNPETEFAKTYVGTPFYMSPELVTEALYNAKSDVWALGCLIYELCALEPPFQAKSQAALAAKIRQGKVPELPRQYSNDLRAAIRAMLQTNQHKRPSTAELLKLDRVRLAVRERELNQLHADLKRKEADLAKREEALCAREANVAARERMLGGGLGTPAASVMDIPETPRESAYQASQSFSAAFRSSSSIQPADAAMAGSETPDPFGVSGIAGGTPASTVNSTPAARLSKGSSDLVDQMRSPDPIDSVVRKATPSSAFLAKAKENRGLHGGRPLATGKTTPAMPSPLNPARAKPSSGLATPASRVGLRTLPRHMQLASAGGSAASSAATTPLSTLAKQMTRMTLASPMQMSP